MGYITKHDLSEHTAAVLRQVTESGDIIVTEHGEPRWRISAYQHYDAVLTRLERQGHYTPAAKDPAPWPTQPSGPKYSAVEIEELLEEIRGPH